MCNALFNRLLLQILFIIHFQTFTIHYSLFTTRHSNLTIHASLHIEQIDIKYQDSVCWNAWRCITAVRERRGYDQYDTSALFDQWNADLPATDQHVKRPLLC